MSVIDLERLAEYLASCEPISPFNSSSALLERKAEECNTASDRFDLNYTKLGGKSYLGAGLGISPMEVWLGLLAKGKRRYERWPSPEVFQSLQQNYEQAKTYYGNARTLFEEGKARRASA